MKRREFFKCTVGVAATLIFAKLLEAEPEVIGVDMSTEGADATVVSLHGTDAATPNDLGGFLIPQGHVDELMAALMAALKEEDKRNNVFRVRGTSRTVTWREREREPSIVPLSQVHQSFAQFLSEGAA